MSRDDRNRQLAGVALTGIGGVSAATGGILLGLTAGACRSEDQGCAGRVALPVLGTLWVAAGVVPLVLGVSIWAPQTPSNQGEKARAWLKPEVTVGPSAASLRFRF